MHYTPWQLTNPADVVLTRDRILSYDSEFVRERNYYPKLSLVQIMQPEWKNANLIDMQNGDHKALLKKIAEHNAPVVMHAADQDLELMFGECGILPKTLRDTQIGFALCHRQTSVSYAEFIETYLGTAVDKSETRSDWLARPLSNEQLNYAANDVGPLTVAYTHLTAELMRLGRLSWWAEECEHLLEQQKQDDKEPYHWFRLRGAPQQIRKAHQNAAEALTRLRESVAAEADLPRRKILSDEKLISIALKEPKDIKDVIKLLGDDHKLLINSERADKIFAANIEIPAPVKARAPRITAENKKAFDAATKFTEDTAAELNISADTLAPPKYIRQWVNSKFEDPFLSTGWRGEIFAAFRG